MDTLSVLRVAGVYLIGQVPFHVFSLEYLPAMEKLTAITSILDERQDICELFARTLADSVS